MTATIDETRLESFVGRWVEDLGTIAHAVTVLLGDRLGLYEAMADEGWLTAEEVADRAGVDARIVQEWLAAQAAAGYVELDGDRFLLPSEHAAALVAGRSPFYIPSAFLVAGSGFKDVGQLVEAVRDGRGFGWHEHDHDLFVGTEQFFRPGYLANLTSSWIPALTGVEERLRAGASVADVGCGLGASTILMAEAYPDSTFVGYDYHDESIRLARKVAAENGLSERVRFEVAAADEIPLDGHDLIATFDCLHDLGDPVGAARRIHDALDADGTWLLVEPMAGDSLADNLNPVGKVFYALSTFICTPTSQAQPVGAALGAQASDAQLEGVASAAGFTRFRRATETPFNRIFEVRR